MNTKQLGKQSVYLPSRPRIPVTACVGGPTEAEGPLGRYFDQTVSDSRFGAKSWEGAESAMLQGCCQLLSEKAAGQKPDFILCGDLLDQCTATGYAMRAFPAPLLGLYGACSTFGEALALGAMLVDGQFARSVMAAASSHFCSAERQFRNPLPYGSQRCPGAQWTVTAAGAARIDDSGIGPAVTHVTLGRVIDAGVKDMTDMGAAMAPAAYDTLQAHFADCGRSAADYDLIVTGDLGAVGSELLRQLFARDGVALGERYTDGGLLIYDRTRQDVHAGGSGCGCSAAVFCGYLMDGLRSGRWGRLLLAPTGALMSPTVNRQGESIPAVCHAVAIEAEGV